MEGAESRSVKAYEAFVRPLDAPARMSTFRLRGRWLGAGLSGREARGKACAATVTLTPSTARNRQLARPDPGPATNANIIRKCPPREKPVAARALTLASLPVPTA